MITSIYVFLSFLLFCFERFFYYFCFLSDQTVFMKASEEGHVEIVKVLVENGADVNLKDEE